MSGVEQALRQKPEIIISPELTEVLDAAEAALMQLGGIYVRSRQLVHVVHDRGSPGWLKRPEGMPVIEPIATEHMFELLARAATWLRYDKRKKGEKEAQLRAGLPMPGLAKMLLTRGQWRFPELESVVDAPMLRHDGSIVDRPGYDHATRVIYAPGQTSFPSIPEAPARRDAVAALAELLEPFGEFPFVAESDRSAVVALILSIVGRAAIEGCAPMFAVRAPTPGSGKGLIVEIAARIATGRAPAIMLHTTDEDETRKRLLSIAIEAPSLILLDNVVGSIGSPALAGALTTESVSDRLLGVNKNVTASLRSVWAVTGNNLSFKSDLGRRVVPIDLDPRCENPEDRTFSRTPAQLRDHVQTHRPSIVVAALTLLRSFVTAGKPTHGKPAKGSFESWDQLVRGAIIWAGGADPLGGVQRLREEGDDDLDRIRALLTSWYAELGSEAVTIGYAIQQAGDGGNLHDAMSAWGKSGKPDVRALGYALRGLRGRIVQGLEIMQASTTDHSGAKLWRVIRSADDADDADDAYPTRVKKVPDLFSREGLETSSASPASSAKDKEPN